jgi:archaemetzincin
VRAGAAALGLLGLLGLVALAGAAPAGRAIYLQPLGRELPDADVALVTRALVEIYGVDVRALARVDLPLAAWYAPRRRWRAEKLLAFLAPRLPPDGARVVGLTGADISTTKEPVYDWGVLGLGDLDGPACVISSFRCRRGARDAQHARERLAKVAVHEIGHTLGLDHCPTVGCLMEDAEGKVATADREYDLCPRCRARVAATGRALPLAPRIPWPVPARGP